MRKRAVVKQSTDRSASYKLNQLAPRFAQETSSRAADANKIVRTSRKNSVGSPDGKEVVKSRYTVQSLATGLQVLEALVRAGGLVGVSELAAQLGVTKWVAFRHLQTLCEQGFAVRDPSSDKYEAGRRLIALMDTLPPRFAWIHRAREEMHRLRQEVGLTVALAGLLRDQSGVTIIDVHTGNQDVLLTPKLGAVFDFHCSAHGKIALAYGKEELLTRVIEGTLASHAPKTITNTEELLREIRKVKKRGWADAAEQDEPNMNALTAPIFSQGGQYEGSIGIFGSIDQLPANPPVAYVRAVTTAAQRISRRLGAT